MSDEDDPKTPSSRPSSTEAPNKKAPSEQAPSEQAQEERKTPDYTRESSVTRVKGSPERAAKRPPLDQDGRERPAFLLNYPEDPKLEELIRAFERGDFLAVRRNAPELVRTAPSQQVKNAAEELLERIEPDPKLKVFLFASLGLLLFIVVWTYGFSHAH